MEVKATLERHDGRWVLFVQVPQWMTDDLRRESETDTLLVKVGQYTDIGLMGPVKLEEIPRSKVDYKRVGHDYRP